MALPFQSSNPFQIPESAKKVIPPELGEQFLGVLGSDLELQEKKQMEDLLGFQESRGLLRSGDTNRRLVEDVLGPGEKRRQRALLPLAFRGAEIGQKQEFEATQERVAFEQQRQFAQEEFQRRLQFLHEQATLQQQLMQLQSQLELDYAPGFGTAFEKGLGGGLSTILSLGIGAGAKGLFSNLGSFGGGGKGGDEDIFAAGMSELGGF